jgi:predicted RNA-binding protein with PIN domain
LSAEKYGIVADDSVMPVIVDGYNLLWAIQYTAGDSGAITDLQMCFTLGRYFSAKGETGEVIFDGTGPPDKEPFFSINSLGVSFVGFRTDADTVIEEKIAASTAPKNLKIVTNDRRIKDAARRRRAQLLGSEQFWAEVKKYLSQKKKKDTDQPYFKKHGISETETDMWMKYFGLEEDEG